MNNNDSKAPRNVLLSIFLLLHPPISKHPPSAPWTHTFSVPVAQLTHPTKETGKAKMSLTKKMISCTQQLNVYSTFGFVTPYCLQAV